MINPKAALILSGSGVFDGTEIHEATMTMLAIMQNGGTYDIFAPNIFQHHVINHLTGEAMDEKRNVLVESARIARGKIKDLKDFDASQYDALFLPGGFGAAKNLSDFAFKGQDCQVINDVKSAILQMVNLNKPIGALCIAPALLAKVLEGAKITIGNDSDTVNTIEAMGGIHQNTNHGEVAIDKCFKLATTPCYMLDATIVDIALGAQNVVKAVFDMIH